MNNARDYIERIRALIVSNSQVIWAISPGIWCVTLRSDSEQHPTTTKYLLKKSDRALFYSTLMTCLDLSGEISLTFF